MTLDDFSLREGRGAVAAVAAVVAVAFGAGYVAADVVGTPSGAVTGDAVSEDEIRQQVQSLMDQQLSQQRQQLQMMVNQSANLTMDDVSMDATVDSVEPSKFGSLYKVNVTMQGEVPRRLGSGTRQIDQEQVMYISEDGRYLFPEPTDLEQPQRQQPMQPQ